MYDLCVDEHMPCKGCQGQRTTFGAISLLPCLDGFESSNLGNKAYTEYTLPTE